MHEYMKHASRISACVQFHMRRHLCLQVTYINYKMNIQLAAKFIIYQSNARKRSKACYLICSFILLLASSLSRYMHVSFVYLANFDLAHSCVKICKRMTHRQYFLNKNLYIKTLRCDIFAHRTHREKIFLLYNSKPSLYLELDRFSHY